MSAKEGCKAIFSVSVGQPFDHLFDDYTSVYVSGGHSALGQWNPSAAIRLEKSVASDIATTWTIAIPFPDDVNANEVGYRYFIGRCTNSSSSDKVHVLKWETSLKPRRLTIDDKNAVLDEFGNIGGVHAVSDGWLSDPNLTEVRFFLFDRSSIGLSKPSTDFASSLYKISVKAFEKKGENSELTVDINTVVFASVINKASARAYHPIPATNLPKESYTIGQDLLCFRIHTSTPLERLTFRFCIHDAKSSGMATADVKLQQPDQLQGKVSAALIDSNKKVAVGILATNYLVIRASTPNVLKFCTMEKSYMSYWKRRQPLDIGHRGMGRSYTKNAKERENTLKSLVTACEKGADFVEFDVQLTKDQVPVLYHDFQVCLEENGKLNEYGFKDFTVEQLRTLHIRHTHDLKKPDDRSYMPVVGRKQESVDPSCRAFPFLEEVLKSSPPHLGFNIEIKYPMFMADGIHFECDGFFELNVYLDRILDVVVKNAKDRRIVFSSFCPEACLVLKAKQNRYPILYLTQGITQRYPSYANPLTLSSEIAIAFALSEGLLGVCFHSEELLRAPDLIKNARNSGLVSFVWGDDLDETKNIEFMRRAGLDGIIYDDMDKHTHGKRNIFAK